MYLYKKCPDVLDSFCPERALLLRLLLGYKKDFAEGHEKPEDAAWVLQYWLDIAFPTIPMSASRFVGLCTGKSQQSDGLILSLSAAPAHAPPAPRNAA